MATILAYRLAPRSAFHFGERGVGLEETAETFRSDSLFGALCSTVREGWGDATLVRLLDAVRAGDGAPFLLSSCFPYAGDVLFFPRPMVPLAGPPSLDAGKRLKHVRFVSRDVFSAWLSGADLAGESGPAAFVAGGRAWTTAAERAGLVARFGEGGADEVPPLWSTGDVPRVTIDRATSASAIYRVGRLTFRAGCGLYFLVAWRDQALRPLVEAALHVLGDAGLGGRRSAGNGQFRPLPPVPLDLPAPDDADALLTLALYWPTEAELRSGVLAGPARYDLVVRQGWTSSPDARALRRREVRMLVEGSVMRAPPDATLGGLVDVTPAGFVAHPVYRYGLAFPLPVRVGERADG